MQEEVDDIDIRLHEFVGSSVPLAQHAFDLLMAESRPRLEGWVRPFAPNRETMEDILQEAYLRVWRSRETFQPRGGSSWWKYMKITAIRCGIDHTRMSGPSRSDDPDEVERIPDRDQWVIDTLIEFLGDRERLYRLANEVWLGTPPPEHSRRILAAKLFYIDGLPWSQVCDILSAGYPGRPRLQRQDLDAWLADAVLVRYLACEVLYYSNAKLCALILGIPADGSDRFEDLLSEAQQVRDSVEGANWTDSEIQAILWRYRYGKLVEQIEHIGTVALEKKDLQLIFDRCREEFPFTSVMEKLKARLDRIPSTTGVLGKTGIWRRLIFQYFANDELSHRDIHDRTAPAAQMAGYNLTMGMLNVWLSNGRLFAQLAKHVQDKEH